MNGKSGTEAVLVNTRVDLSSDARTNIWDKYCSFNGIPDIPVWSHAPDGKCIDSVRSLLFDINPHHIICVYKKMFETAAISNLRLVSDDGVGYSERDINGIPDRNSSCVDIKAQQTPIKTFRKLELNGWNICNRQHSARNTGYKKLTTDDSRESTKGHGKYVEKLPLKLRVLRNQQHHKTTYNSSAITNSRESPSERLASVPSHDCPENNTSHSSSLAGFVRNSNTPVKVGRGFIHYNRNSSYIVQYRNEYRYGLFEFTVPNNDVYLPSSSGSMTPASCTQRSCPTQNSLYKSKASLTRNKDTSIHTWIPVLSRSPPAHNRSTPYAVRVPKIDNTPKEPRRLGYPRGGIFTTSLTVNAINIIKHIRVKDTSASNSPSVLVSTSHDSWCGHPGNMCSPATHVTTSYHN